MKSREKFVKGELKKIYNLNIAFIQGWKDDRRFVKIFELLF